MSALIASMSAVTDLEGGSEAANTKQIEALQAVMKTARALSKTAAAEEQFAFFRAACALNERIGHQDSFGVMRSLAHVVDGVWIALEPIAKPEMLTLVEGSVRRRLNGETYRALRAYAKAPRTLAMLEELRAAGAPFLGIGGAPAPSHYDVNLEILREYLVDGDPDADDEDTSFAVSVPEDERNELENIR